MNSNAIKNMTFWSAFPSYVECHRHYVPHAHAWHELVLIQQGQYRSHVGGKHFIAGPGDILFYTSGTVHEEWVEGDRPVLTWVCLFEGEGFSHDEPIFRHDVEGRLQETIAKLNSFWMEDYVNGGNPNRYTPVLHSLLEQLDQLPAKDSNAMVAKVRTFVRNHMTEPFSVANLADVAALSVSHFVRQYRDITGRTPMEDVRYIRVQEASRLIVNTHLPLHEIAPMVGISDAYHLSKLLKSLLGVTVKDLRNLHS